MKQEPDLKEIQKRAYMSYHQDGLLDICLGICILGFPLAIFVDRIWDLGIGAILPTLVIITMMPIYIQAKRKVTLPRIGFVKFGPREAGRFMGVLLGVMIAGVALALVFALSVQGGMPSWMQALVQYAMIVMGLVGLAIFSLFGHSMGLRRLYAYGLLTLALFVGGYFIGIYFEYVLLILGLIITAVGFAMLISFVRKYPLQGD